MIRTWDQIFAELDRLTAPAGHWTIERDDHRSVYESVADHADGWEDQFESPEEWSRAVRENRMVVLHWYVDTPVGSYKLRCPDMDALRRRVSRLIDEVVSEI